MGELADTPLGFSGGNPFDAADWALGVDWSIAGGILLFNKIAMFGGFADQNTLTLTGGSSYHLQITASNYTAAFPGTFFALKFNEIAEELIINANGTYTFDYFSPDDHAATAKFRFHPINFIIGDSCDFSVMILEVTGAYVEDQLGITVIDPTYSNFWEAAQADYYQNLSSRTDASNCGILYNNPP